MAYISPPPHPFTAHCPSRERRDGDEQANDLTVFPVATVDSRPSTASGNRWTNYIFRCSPASRFLFENTVFVVAISFDPATLETDWNDRDPSCPTSTSLPPHPSVCLSVCLSLSLSLCLSLSLSLSPPISPSPSRLSLSISLSPSLSCEVLRSQKLMSSLLRT